MTSLRNFRYQKILALLFALGSGYCTDVQPIHAQAVKGVTVSCTLTSLLLGGRTNCTARAKLANGTFTSPSGAQWYSSNSKVAVVSDKGAVSTIGAGNATITAGLRGYSGSAFLTVTNTNPTPTPTPIVTAASVSIALGSTSLPVGQTTQATATPRDSSGNVLTTRAVTWTSVTPGFATVDAKGVVTAIAAGSATIKATVDTISKTATVTVTAAPAPPTNDTSKASAVLAFAGPTIAVSSVPLSQSFYETNFTTNIIAQWAAYGPQWDAGNSISGYERAAIYYVWWARTGDTTYLNRAHATAINYRDNFLIPGGYAVSPHWSQMESMYLDWLVTGDTLSRHAIIEVANRIGLAFPPSGYFDLSQGEARIQARVIMSLWMAEKVAGSSWTAPLDSAIMKALSVMNSNGWAPFVSTCGGSLNYMNGMLYDVLTRIRDQRPKALYNTLIDTKALAYGNYLWSSPQWRPADKSFNYVSLECIGTGSPTASNDLNGLMLPLIGWLGKSTGDTVWFARGDSVLLGQQTASLYLYRQFSESYSSSFRYFGYRYPGSVIPAGGGGSRIRRP